MFQKSKAFPFHSKVLPQHKRQDITGKKCSTFFLLQQMYCNPEQTRKKTGAKIRQSILFVD